jgi:hypothetical protein
MAIHKVNRKQRGTMLNTGGIPILRLDRDTVLSLSKKLRSALADIEKLKTDVLNLQERVRELEERDV